MNAIDIDALMTIAGIKEPEIPETRKEYIEVDYVVDGFVVENNKYDNEYRQRKIILEYLRYYKKLSYKEPKIRVAYENAAKMYKNMYDKDVVRMISEDLEELDIIFRAKAYKTTLILTGSILEAFLLDWLSEKDGKNYFKQKYKTKHIGKDGKEYWVKDDSLETYIDNIPELQKPEWMAENAHKIRKARNNVHAKLCMKHTEEINEETCKMVIGYLNDVIEARLKIIDELTQES